MPLSQPARPVGKYDVSPLVDLSDKENRARLTPSALKAFFNILGKWAVDEEDGLRLLGGVSRAKFYSLKKNPAGVLDQDKLQRVSLLVGIFKALNILHSEQLADAWVSLPNKNRIFAGQTPLQLMVKGGLPSMLVVRRLLDARRGGV
ncbi:MAG: DUF2384 domain-containing protein [Desulfovibrionaceae bacterium]|jgi:hypothetical protein|nr:DUF2384 domain-containing protein [Desulfovibrionaceae bacterium]